MWSMHSTGRGGGAVQIQSTDPMVPPLIHPRYLEEEENAQILVDGIYKIYKKSDIVPMVPPLIVLRDLEEEENRRVNLW